MSPGRPYPIYIVLTPFREIAPSVRVMFRALDKVEPYLDYIEGFYRDDGDEALVALQFKREAIEQAGPDRFFEIVRRCNLPIIAPEKLTMERRVSFHHEHLASFPTRVQRYRMGGESMVQSIVVALEEHVAYEAELEDDDHYVSVELEAELEPEISIIPEPIDDSEPRRRSSKWELPLPDTTVDAQTVPAVGPIDPTAEAAFDAAATMAFDASLDALSASPADASGEPAPEAPGEASANGGPSSEPDVWF